MKKLLFIPLDYSYNPYQELLQCFKEKFDTMYYTDQQSALDFKPDFIFAQSSALEPDKLMEIRLASKSFVMQWSGDCRVDLLPEVVAYKDVCDVTLLAVGVAHKEMYEAVLQHPVRYMQHTVSMTQFVVPKQLDNGKIVFIGNNYNHFPGAAERSKLCEILTTEFENFEVWGNGFNTKEYRNPDSIAWEKSQFLYNDSYIGISANIFNDYEGYWSDRPLHIMAAGCCCLMRYVPKLEHYFKDMVHCVFYKSNEEAIDKIKYLMANPDVRNQIALEGQKEILKHHTNNYRVQQIIEITKEFKKWK